MPFAACSPDDNATQGMVQQTNSRVGLMKLLPHLCRNGVEAFGVVQHDSGNEFPLTLEINRLPTVLKRWGSRL